MFNLNSEPLLILLISCREDMTPHHRLQSYYGYSFESFCTTSTPDVGQQPGWSGDVDNNVQWCSVVKTKLGDTRLLIGGEVDCVRGEDSTLQWI